MSPTAEADKLHDVINEKRLIGMDEVKLLLGRVSKDYVYNLMNNKKDRLPSVKIRGLRQFQLDKVLWWIENHAEA